MRYKFQSGYSSNKYKRIALGSLHFGCAIEQAFNQGLGYDLMPGEGKHSDHKEKTDKHVTEFKSYMWVHDMAKYLYEMLGR